MPEQAALPSHARVQHRADQVVQQRMQHTAEYIVQQREQHRAEQVVQRRMQHTADQIVWVPQLVPAEACAEEGSFTLSYN